MRTLIIAEAGVNHNGDIQLARQLIDAARNAGADCIKFQTFKAENIVSKFARKADYQKKTTNADKSQLDMLRQLELSFDDFRDLQVYCRKVGITFLSTPFDLESLEFLEELDMDFSKVSSGEITNLPYLMAIARTGRKVLLSTGMSTCRKSV